MNTDQEIINDIKKGKLPVIIFGAGIAGEVLFHACRDAGIKVECFCDNNVNKTKFPLCGLKIIHASDLKRKYKDADFLISAADIKDVVEQLNCLGYSKWHNSTSLLRDFSIHKCQLSAPMDFVEYAVNTCLLCHDSYLTPEKLFLRSIDIIITERCSLKCKNCSNLTQYYEDPKDCDIEELMKSIDTFCGIVDKINEFRVIGGEPFMNKDFDIVVKRLTNESKVEKVVIYTNGTIVPTEEKMECLKNDKILLMITDYGELSRNLSNLIRKLSENNIAFYNQKVGGWFDCGKIGRHHRDIKSQKGVFGNCCAKNLVTLSDNKLYRCPFAANAARLRAVPDYKSDYIDLSQESLKNMDVCKIKNKIRSFLLEKKFFRVCDFCNGVPYGGSEIIPAVQADRPLEYKKY